MRPTMWALCIAAFIALVWAAIRGPHRTRPLIVCGILCGAVFIFYLKVRGSENSLGQYEESFNTRLDHFSTLIHTMFVEYAPRLFEPTLAQALFGTRLGPGLNTLAGIAILILSVSLLWIRPLWGLWVGMTVAVVLVAIKPLDRYFLEVLPLLVFAWWTGLRWFERRFSGKWVSVTFITLFLLGATTNLLRIGEFIVEQRRRRFLEYYKEGRFVSIDKVTKMLEHRVEPDAWVIAPPKVARILTFLSKRHIIEPTPEYHWVKANYHTVYVLEPLEDPAASGSRQRRPTSAPRSAIPSPAATTPKTRAHGSSAVSSPTHPRPSRPNHLRTSVSTAYVGGFVVRGNPSFDANRAIRLEQAPSSPYNSPKSKHLEKASDSLSDKTEHPPVPEAFAALGVRPSILRALADAKFVTPSEIQALLIPRALAGVDILGQARTGTGKTAAFGIPILQQVRPRAWPRRRSSSSPRASWPCRSMPRSSASASSRPSAPSPVYGGQKITAQMKFLKHGPEILVGTPGRVIDLLDRRIINFDNIRFVVLDEVDRMLDIGFRDDIRNILSRVKGDVATPDADETRRRAAQGDSDGRSATRHRVAHQTIFVSATISDEIEKLGRAVHARAGREAHRARRRRKADGREGRAVLLLRPAVGQIPPAAACCWSRRTRTWRSSSAAPSAAPRSSPSSCTPTASSAARSTATSPRTSATA